jgi:beta-fructofuranosidase
VWAINAPDTGVGPFDVASAYRLADQTLYVGRLIQRRDGQWVMLAFRNEDSEGRFVGEITDPMAVGWDGGRLVLRDASDARAVPVEERRAGH